jgi:microsomal dipeptidase-like Zn-dependent dipeptidase
MLGDKAERVDTFADLGLRIVQLTYNSLNRVGGGSMAPGNPGLTPFGHEVVERLNNRRIVVDLSHSGQRICLDARGSRNSRSRSPIPAARKWRIRRAARPTRNCGWWPNVAAMSASIG